MNLSYENYLKLEKFIESCNDKRKSLIIILHKAQEIFGYIPNEVQEFISECTQIDIKKISELVNFYSFFSTEPKEKYKILVCTGIQCVKKKGNILLKELEDELGIKDGEVTRDGKFLLKSVGCLGACGVGPIVVVGQKLIEKADINKVKQIIKSL